MCISFRNLTGTSAALLPRYLPNFSTISDNCYLQIFGLRNFARSYNKTSYWILKHVSGSMSNKTSYLLIVRSHFQSPETARILYPAGRWRNYNIIMKSKWGRDVVLMSLWCYYCVMYPLGTIALKFDRLPNQHVNHASYPFEPCPKRKKIQLDKVFIFLNFQLWICQHNLNLA